MKVDAILWPHGFHPVSSQSFETVELFHLDEAEVVSSQRELYSSAKFLQVSWNQVTERGTPCFYCSWKRNAS